MALTPGQLEECLQVALAPVLLATEFNKSITADTDILASDLAINEDCVLRIIVSESAGVVFKAKILRDAVEKILDFNEGFALTANALYTFDLPVKKDDKVNFRASADTTLNILNVMKVKTMGP
jgi:hypothetical protein